MTRTTASPQPSRGSSRDRSRRSRRASARSVVRASARPARHGDAGMVSAEIATALPGVVALTLALVCVVAAVGAQLRCQDLARESVRALARGESTGSVRERVLPQAPPHASLRVRRSSGLVTATVTATAPVLGTSLLRLPGLPVGATATAADEKRLAEQPW